MNSAVTFVARIQSSGQSTCGVDLDRRNREAFGFQLDNPPRNLLGLCTQTLEHRR